MRKKSGLVVLLSLVMLLTSLWMNHVQASAQDISPDAVYVTVPSPYLGESLSDFINRIQFVNGSEQYYVVSPTECAVNVAGIYSYNVPGNDYVFSGITTVGLIITGNLKSGYNYPDTFNKPDLYVNGVLEKGKVNSEGRLTFDYLVIPEEKRVKYTVYFADVASETKVYDNCLPGQDITISPVALSGKVFDHFEAQGVTIQASDYDGQKLRFKMPLNDVVIRAIYKNKRKLTVIYDNDTAHPQVSEVLEGNQASVTLKDIQGKAFDHYEVDDPDGGTNYYYEPSLTFTMPKGDVTVRTVYKEVGTLTVNVFVPKVADGNKYADATTTKDVAVEGFQPRATKTKGEKIEVRGDTFEPWHLTFDYWSAEGMNLTEAQKKNPKLSFDFPGGNVVLTAHQKHKPEIMVRAFHDDMENDIPWNEHIYAEPGEEITLLEEEIDAKFREFFASYKDDTSNWGQFYYTWGDGYKFDHLEIIFGADEQKSEDGKLTFNVGETSVVVKALYKKPTVTVNAYFPEHTYTYGGEKKEERTVELRKYSAEAGTLQNFILNMAMMEDRTFQPVSWSSEDIEISEEASTGEQLEFIMPDHDVTLTINCKPKGFFVNIYVLPDGTEVFRSRTVNSTCRMNYALPKIFELDGVKYYYVRWEAENSVTNYDPNDPYTITIEALGDGSDLVARIYLEEYYEKNKIIGHFRLPDGTVKEAEIPAEFGWEPPNHHYGTSVYTFEGREYVLKNYTVNGGKPIEVSQNELHNFEIFYDDEIENEMDFYFESLIHLINLSPDGKRKEELFAAPGEEVGFRMLLPDTADWTKYEWKAEGMTLTKEQRNLLFLNFITPENDAAFTVQKKSSSRRGRTAAIAGGSVIFVGGGTSALIYRKKRGIRKDKVSANSKRHVR